MNNYLRSKIGLSTIHGDGGFQGRGTIYITIIAVPVKCVHEAVSVGQNSFDAVHLLKNVRNFRTWYLLTVFIL